MTTVNTWYEVKSPDNSYGLDGTFFSENDALDEINASYKIAKMMGYDNPNKQWIIVYCIHSKTFKDGRFLSEKTEKYVTQTVEYSFYENKFVFTF